MSDVARRPAPRGTDARSRVADPSEHGPADSNRGAGVTSRRPQPDLMTEALRRWVAEGGALSRTD